MQQDLIAGDSLNFATTVPGYPASAGWVLKYRLVPRTVGGTAISLTATAELDDFRIAVAATITAAWGVDNYTWSAWVDKAGEIYTIDSGQITIKPDPRVVAVGLDGRSVAEKALADARAAMAAWTPTSLRYKIGEREMWFNTKADIIGVISYWEVQVKREHRQKALASGLPDPAKTYVRVIRE